MLFKETDNFSTLSNPSNFQPISCASLYSYTFNGKESDTEVKGSGNQYDYGFRIYDSRVARFLSVDPLARKFSELTPYQYASNSPIANIDLDGLEANLSIFAKEGGAPPELNSFNARAEKVKTRFVAATVHGIVTGQDFIDLLKTKTNDEGSIQSFTIFSHSVSEGVVLKSSAGFYRTGSVFSGGAESAVVIDVVEAIKNGSIKFEDDAIGFFAGCNSSNPNQYNMGISLSENFTDETGITSIGSLGGVAPQIIDGKETGRLVSKGFVKYEKQDNGTLKMTNLGTIIDPVQIMNKMTSIEPKQIVQVETKPVDRELKQ